MLAIDYSLLPNEVFRVLLDAPKTKAEYALQQIGLLKLLMH